MRGISILMMVALLGAVGGCSFYVGPETLGPAEPLPEGELSPAFLDRMASATHVSEDDGLRGMLLLLDGKDEATTFDERVAQLRRRKIVAQRWDCRPGRALTRGRLAYMIYQADGVPGGLILRLTGPSQRYCLRELEYRGIMSKGGRTSRVTGMEFVAVLSRAAELAQAGEVPDYMSTGGR